MVDKKKIMKHIRQNTDKMDLQMGFSFLDNTAMKKLGVSVEDLIELFGSSNVQKASEGSGYTVRWK